MNTFAMRRTRPSSEPIVIARRALLLRAGQSPLEPHLGTALGGYADRKRATPITMWATPIHGDLGTREPVRPGV